MSLINAVLFKEGRVWIAQGIERDICVQGHDFREAIQRFELTVKIEAEEPGGLDRIAPAPEAYRKSWRDGLMTRFSVSID